MNTARPRTIWHVQPPPALFRRFPHNAEKPVAKICRLRYNGIRFKQQTKALESNDVFVEIEPWDQGLQLTLESVVKQQFGDAIERSVRETLAQCGVEQAKLNVVDQGALDCVLRARVETAVARGREGQA